MIFSQFKLDICFVVIQKPSLNKTRIALIPFVVGSTTFVTFTRDTNESMLNRGRENKQTVCSEQR